MSITEQISDERITEIKDQLHAWSQRHRAHSAGCGCNPYQDVICGLPEYDPEDPRNLAIPEQLDEYVLSDGAVIDGDREGWAIYRAGRA